MHEIQKIGAVSLAKFQAIIVGLLAAVFGLPVLLLEAAVPGAGITSYLGILLVSIIGAFLAGLITALLYNILAGLIGGIKLDLSDSTTAAE